MNNINPKADFFFKKAGKWQAAFEILRNIALETELTEDIKWGCPCYTYRGKNIFLIHGFKNYCALLFFKGALMNDPEHLLVQQTENVQSARQMRFTGAQEIADLENFIRNYILNAVEVEKSGAKVETKPAKAFEIPEEFRYKLETDAKLKAAFETLTPGRQRAYLLYFSSARQSNTRASRIEKCLPSILEGKGLND